MASQTARCVIAFGGNLGNADDTFLKALASLQKHGFTLEKMSAVITTKAVDCEPDAPDFRNAAAVGYWKNHDPYSLLALCRKLEAEFGRPNNHAKGISRTLDLDLIWFDSQKIQDAPTLILPHPRAKERTFVTVPLSEIAPELLAEL